MFVPLIDSEATGRNLRRMMKERGITVKQVEDVCCVRNQCIYRWLNGHNLPTIDNLYAVSKLLGVHMEDIVVPHASGPTPT